MPSFVNLKTGVITERDSEIDPKTGMDLSVPKAQAEGMRQVWPVVNPKTGDKHFLATGIKEALDKGYVIPEQYDAMQAAATPNKPEPGAGQSFLLGVPQGLTAGFADEIGGGIMTPIRQITNLVKGEPVQGMVDTYKSERDKIREATEAARTNHPYATFAGEVLGGVALPIGAGVVKTAGLGQAAAKAGLAGAGQGALGGVGEAKEMLNEQGDFNREMLKDAAIGGAVGGVAGGVLGATAKAAGTLIGAVKSGAMKGQNPLSLKFWTDNPAIDNAFKYLSQEPAFRKAAGDTIGKAPEEISDKEMRAVIAEDLAKPGPSPLKTWLSELVATDPKAPGYNKQEKVLQAFEMGPERRTAARNWEAPEQLAEARDVAGKFDVASKDIEGALWKKRDQLEQQAKRQFAQRMEGEWQDTPDWIGQSEFRGEVSNTLNELLQFGDDISKLPKGQQSVIPKKDRDEVAMWMTVLREGAEHTTEDGVTRGVHGVGKLKRRNILPGALEDVPFDQWYDRLQFVRTQIDQKANYYADNHMTPAAELLGEYRSLIDRVLKSADAKVKSDEIVTDQMQIVAPALKGLQFKAPGAPARYEPAKTRGVFGERPAATRTRDMIAEAEAVLAEAKTGNDPAKLKAATDALAAARQKMEDRNLLMGEGFGRAGGQSARAIEGTQMQGQLADIVRSPGNFLALLDEQWKLARKGLPPADEGAFIKLRALLRSQLGNKTAQKVENAAEATKRTGITLSNAIVASGLSQAAIRALFQGNGGNPQ